MAPKRLKTPTLLDVLFSIIVEPSATTQRLLSITPPPHLFTTLFLFLCVCIAPPLAQVGSKVPNSDIPQVIPAILTVVLTLILTTIFAKTALTALRTHCSLRAVGSNLIYASAPLITLMVVILVANQLISGELSLLTFLGTASADNADVVVGTYPLIFRIAILLCLTVLSSGYASLTRATLFPGFLMALGTIPLILGSFVVALTLIDLAIPDSSIGTIRFLETFLLWPR
jgi:hypothetical protein